MGKKSAPAPPDYRAAAEEQAAGSKEIATQQTYANRPTINTPWGTMSWETAAGTDPSTGAPVTNWTSNVNLSPQQQAALDAQMGIQQGRSEAAGQFLGQVLPNATKALDLSGVPQGGSLTPGGSEAWRQRAQDAVTEFQRPLQQRRRSAVETQLANQGITRGSEAWKNAMTDLGDEEARASLQALGEGRAESQLGFGQDLQSAQFAQGARQQGIQEQAYTADRPLNQLNALLTGQQVQSPQFSTFNQASAGQAPQLLNAAGQQYGASLDAFNARQQQNAGLMSGLFSLGSAAIPFAFSDARLKEILAKLGTLPNGLSVYLYRIFGRLEVGLLAQEVQKVHPAAVRVGPLGFLMVNYTEAVK